ncbi:MAG: acetaldehyde dehydrogenase (acetylating) [Ruminococcaceae bacterium]|nr:acetaldehyde dehydrogenase (acetylating) [Oscillospiraceae bacterium]
MELDKDLSARQEARVLAKQAQKAQEALGSMPQEKLDAIVEAVAKAFSKEAPALAEMAVSETGFGNVEDKIRKNRFASETVAEAVRGMQTVGFLREDRENRIWEYGVPVGVIAAIVPSTNPTSTVCYKALIALKSGNSIVFSPHPKAIVATRQAAKIVAEAAEVAGAPKGAVSCLSIPALQGCQELMTAPQTRLILATGGPAMVKAAYSSGKPAIGVGAGNGPAYIHRSADVKKALSRILRSKTFDNGTVCASEQSIIVEKDLEDTVLREARAQGFYLMSPEEAGKLAKLLFKPNGALSPDVVGKTAQHLAKMAGFSVPRDTKILLAREREAGPSVPYSMEKLCPVLAFYVMEDEDAVLDKVVQVLTHEGSGHTFAMHAEDESVIRKFAAKVPVSRFLVNTPAALGGIGASTGLFPALTLGCGAVGGSSSSNNISPLDLINIRRVAWDVEKTPQPQVQLNSDLVELLTRKILERLG